jgi:hypothetical protein
LILSAGSCQAVGPDLDRVAGPVTFLSAKPLQEFGHFLLQEGVQPPHALEPLTALRRFAVQDTQTVVGIPPQPAHGVDPRLHEAVPSVAADAVIVTSVAGLDRPFENADVF